MTAEIPGAFITEHNKSKLIHITDNPKPSFELIYRKNDAPRNRESDIVDAVEFIDNKSYKAKGKRLTTFGVKKINIILSEVEEEVINLDENPKSGNEGAAESIKISEVHKVKPAKEEVSLPSKDSSPDKIKEEELPNVKSLTELESEVTKKESVSKKKKKLAAVKKVKKKNSDSVSMDDDEPLQVTLDF